MSIKKSKRRWLRWLLYFLLFVVVCIIVVALSADQILENRVKNEISAYFKHDSTSMYNIEFDTVKIRIWLGDFKLTNLRVSPKEAYFDSLYNDNLNLVMLISAKQFVVKGLDIRKLLFNDLIEIDKIELRRPVMEYHYNPEVEDDGETKPMNEIMTDVFISASIKDLLIQDAAILIHDVKKDSIIELKIDSATLKVDNILMDTNTIKRNIPFEYGELKLDVREVHLGSLKMYTINFDKFEISIKDSLLAITNFQVIPKYDNDKFNELVGYQGDIFTISSEKLILRGFDTHKMADNKRIDIDAIELTGIDLMDYRDRRIPRPSFKYKPLFSEIIRNIPFTINIKKVIADNGKIAYLEVAPEGEKPGEVVLTDVDLVITNITNDSAILVDKPDMVVDIAAKLMDKSLFKVNLKFPILDESKNFVTQGTLDQIMGSAMNPFLGPAGGVEVKSGDILGASFNIYSDNDISGGTLDIEYEDLKIDVLSAKKEDKSNWFLSLGANAAVKSTNLKDSKKYKQGEIYYERNKDKSFFNFYVKSLMSGLQSVAASFTVQSEEKRAKKKEKESRKEKRKEKKGTGL